MRVVENLSRNNTDLYVSLPYTSSRATFLLLDDVSLPTLIGELKIPLKFMLGFVITLQNRVLFFFLNNSSRR